MAAPNVHTVFVPAMCSLFGNLTKRLPKVVISVAFYGNPQYGSSDQRRRSIDLYGAVRDTCGKPGAPRGDHVSLYLYQNYANWVDGVDSNVAHVKQIGELYSTGWNGWDRLVWGVGVGGDPNWKWYPSDPGIAGRGIMQHLLQDEKAKHLRGTFTWAGEYSEQSCTPAWCVEDMLATTMQGLAWVTGLSRR